MAELTKQRPMGLSKLSVCDLLLRACQITGRQLSALETKVVRRAGHVSVPAAICGNT